MRQSVEGEDGFNKFLDAIESSSANDEKEGSITNEVGRGVTIDQFLDRQVSKTEVAKIEPEVEDRIVAFIDLLGTSALMCKSSEAPAKAYDTYNGILETFEEVWGIYFGGDGDAIQMSISDSYVISVSDDDESFGKLIRMLGRFQCECLAKYSILVRGGISSNKMLKTPESRFQAAKFIGKAFIDAHMLEGSVAIFPRIIVSPGLLNRYPRVSSKTGWVIRDKDGLAYINHIQGNGDLKDQMLRAIDRGIEETAGAEKLRMAQKWMWVKTYTRQFEQERCECCMQNKENC